MSWLRTSPLRQSLPRRQNNGSNGINTFFNSSGGIGNVNQSNYSVLKQRPIDNATDCDPRACYDSFCKHWQQAYEIIQRAESAVQRSPPTHDDVLGVVSHLDFMVTLLLVELHNCNKISLPDITNNPPAPCLEYMLSENLLDKLYEWGCTTGRYSNAVRLEQLKLYELLVSHSRHQLLCHEPFLRPLLKILASSQNEIFPPDLEKRLVILLNQLCVLLMQNVDLLDLFFFTSAQETHSPSNFIIFSLLIPYVHREGSLGHQARDALLLCMALSQKNSNIGIYIAKYSSMCHLLVHGLGGLYSRLPNTIEINSTDWHRITPDDVTDIPELTLFMNALEFCNAVIQVAHEMIKNQLLDFMYKGFIVTVLGSGILQKLKGKHFQTNVDSQISAMCYLDLILRSVTEPDLIKLFLKFLLDAEKFDGERILDVLVDRLSSNDPNLCLVTMALFETLLNMHCEDLMLELLLKYLLPAKHVPISHRHKINKVNPYANVVDCYLDLTPEVMKRARELTKHKHLGDTAQHTHPSMPSPTSTMSKTIGANWNYYGLHTGDSLYANYHAYLLEAHYRIIQCLKACTKWSNQYKYQKCPLKSGRSSNNNQTLELVKQFVNDYGNTNCGVLEQVDDKKQLDSLQSLGESSGYESFKWRPPDEDSAISEMPSAADAELDSSLGSTKSVVKKETWRLSTRRNDLQLTDIDFSEDLFAQGSVSLGPFLNALWSKLQTFTSNTLYVNLHLSGLITRLACYPLPLIHSILLRPDIVITSDTPTFFQILRILKQQIDAELPVVEDSLEVIDVARSYLIDREFRLINARKATENIALAASQATNSAQSSYASISASSPVQVTPSSSYDPFKRNDNKRKSISKSITSMFSRKSSNGSPSLPLSTPSVNNMSVQTSTNNSISDSTHETSLTTTTTTTLMSTKTTCTINEQCTNDRKGSLGSGINTFHNRLPVVSITPTPPLTNANIINSMSDIGAGALGSEPVSLDSLSSTMGAIATASGGTERTRDLAVCAVILDEWLKELAAIAQEQSVVMVNIDN